MFSRRRHALKVEMLRVTIKAVHPPSEEPAGRFTPVRIDFCRGSTDGFSTYAPLTGDVQQREPGTIPRPKAVALSVRSYVVFTWPESRISRSHASPASLLVLCSHELYLQSAEHAHLQAGKDHSVFLGLPRPDKLQDGVVVRKHPDIDEDVHMESERCEWNTEQAR
jgi:hypothetical protein